MLKQINNLILDMDGVLWRGETPMPGLVDFFATLRRLNIRFVLATNNATKTAVMYTEKLARFGVKVDAKHILTSAEATAAYLSERYSPETAVYIVGEKGLYQAMQAQGFNNTITPEAVRNGATAPLVVVGFNKNATYFDLAMGALLVNKGAEFIGTNPDPSYPHELGQLPGAGSLLAVISTGTGIEPTIIGKPGPTIFQEAVHRLGGDADKTVMVGDRLTTDIAGAQSAGIKTILLLSGVTRREEIEGKSIEPDYVFDDINALAATLAETAVTPA